MTITKSPTCVIALNLSHWICFSSSSFDYYYFNTKINYIFFYFIYFTKNYFCFSENINKKKLESRKKKRITAHIISFEDEDEDNNCSSVSQSAPPTCLNSPTTQLALASLPAGHTFPRPLSASVCT